MDAVPSRSVLDRSSPDLFAPCWSGPRLATAWGHEPDAAGESRLHRRLPTRAALPVFACCRCPADRARHRARPGRVDCAHGCPRGRCGTRWRHGGRLERSGPALAHKPEAVGELIGAADPWARPRWRPSTSTPRGWTPPVAGRQRSSCPADPRAVPGATAQARHGWPLVASQEAAGAGLLASQVPAGQHGAAVIRARHKSAGAFLARPGHAAVHAGRWGGPLRAPPTSPRGPATAPRPPGRALRALTRYGTRQPVPRRSAPCSLAPRCRVPCPRCCAAQGAGTPGDVPRPGTPKPALARENTPKKDRATPTNSDAIAVYFSCWPVLWQGPNAEDPRPSSGGHPCRRSPSPPATTTASH